MTEQSQSPRSTPAMWWASPILDPGLSGPTSTLHTPQGLPCTPELSVTTRTPTGSEPGKELLHPIYVGHPAPQVVSLSPTPPRPSCTLEDIPLTPPHVSSRATSSTRVPGPHCGPSCTLHFISLTPCGPSCTPRISPHTLFVSPPPTPMLCGTSHSWRWLHQSVPENHSGTQLSSCPAPHQGRRPAYPPRTSCWHTV